MSDRSRFNDHRPHLIAFARHIQSRVDAARYQLDGMPRPADAAHIHRLIVERGWTELLNPPASVVPGELDVVEVDHVPIHAVVQAQ